VAWVLWCLALAAFGLLATFRGWSAGGAWPWALGGLASLLPLALALPGWRWLAGVGPRAPQRLRWEADGRCWLQEKGGWSGYVTFAPPRQLGPWFWLQGCGPQGRCEFLLDGTRMEPNAVRALKARVGHRAPTRGEGPRKGA
jgi:hypothetical protein